VHYIAFPIALLVSTFVPTNPGFGGFYVATEPCNLEIHCDLNAAPDFRNLTYVLDEGNHGFRSVSLQKGRFYEFIAGRVDWRTSLGNASPIKIDSSPAWLVTLSREHMRGTGSFNHAVVIQCHNGHLTQLFQARSEGLGASSSSAGVLTLRYPVWGPSDSHASPSGARVQTFRWEEQTSRFIEQPR
jgi:hypothetical protein